ncbi:MAG: hypothetical protein EBX40_01895 [Gammaproteobacteria bacterium]|nr:hypothetical protein [Gammaproteobacteria bacterium]
MASLESLLHSAPEILKSVNLLPGLNSIHRDVLNNKVTRETHIAIERMGDLFDAPHSFIERTQELPFFQRFQARLFYFYSPYRDRFILNDELIKALVFGFYSDIFRGFCSIQNEAVLRQSSLKKLMDDFVRARRGVPADTPVSWLKEDFETSEANKLIQLCFLMGEKDLSETKDLQKITAALGVFLQLGESEHIASSKEYQDSLGQLWSFYMQAWVCASTLEGDFMRSLILGVAPNKSPDLTNEECRSDWLKGIAIYRARGIDFSTDKYGFTDAELDEEVRSIKEECRAEAKMHELSMPENEEKEIKPCDQEKVHIYRFLSPERRVSTAL